MLELQFWFGIESSEFYFEIWGRAVDEFAGGGSSLIDWVLVRAEEPSWGRIILFLSGHLDEVHIVWAGIFSSTLKSGSCLNSEALWSRTRIWNGTGLMAWLLQVTFELLVASSFLFSFTSNQLNLGRSVANRMLASASFTTKGSAIQGLNFSLTRPRRDLATATNGRTISLLSRSFCWSKNYTRAKKTLPFSTDYWLSLLDMEKEKYPYYKTKALCHYLWTGYHITFQSSHLIGTWMIILMWALEIHVRGKQKTISTKIFSATVKKKKHDGSALPCMITRLQRLQDTSTKIYWCTTKIYAKKHTSWYRLTFSTNIENVIKSAAPVTCK